MLCIDAKQLKSRPTDNMQLLADLRTKSHQNSCWVSMTTRGHGHSFKNIKEERSKLSIDRSIGF